jgi:hypothetical protein
MKIMNKKIILSFLVLLFINGVCYATMPFPDKIVKTSDGKIIVKLKPMKFGEAAINIENHRGKILKEFYLDSLGLTFQNYRLSTAGNDWYQNSIAFINKTDEYFIVRLRKGKIIIINLKSNKLVAHVPDSLNNEINQTISQKAIELLDSSDPKERQTGAIVCGQMNIRTAIPKLKELLSDDSCYWQQSGDSPWITVYFVRKAAKEALEAMDEDVSGIIVEEPRDK